MSMSTVPNLQTANSDSDDVARRPTLTLASGSQDGNIRLWVIEQRAEAGGGGSASDDLLDTFEESLLDMGEGETGRKLSNRSHVIAVSERDGRCVHYLNWIFSPYPQSDVTHVPFSSDLLCSAPAARSSSQSHSTPSSSVTRTT